MMKELKAGATITAGTLVLITSGDYSSYSITGLFRAATDVIVPGRSARSGEVELDIALLSTLLEEVPCVEAWSPWSSE
jgi:hypothetical protein